MTGEIRIDYAEEFSQVEKLRNRLRWDFGCRKLLQPNASGTNTHGRANKRRASSSALTSQTPSRSYRRNSRKTARHNT